jgi:hypothetical protein
MKVPHTIDPVKRNSQSENRWPRVKECPKCGGPRCKVAEDGLAGMCFREGGFVVWHAEPDTKPVRVERAYTPADDLPPPAPDEVLDRAYNAFLLGCDLSAKHVDELRARGFARHHVERLMFRTLDRAGPAFVRARGEVGALLEAVPLVRDFERYGTGHLLIPVRDLEGRVVAVRTRLDGAQKGKYRWGYGARARVHVARPEHLIDTKTVWVTEGEIKAELTAAHLGVIVLSLPGVDAGHAEAVKILDELQPQKVVVAFDADIVKNQIVQKARARLLEHLQQGGFPVAFAEWDLAHAKGIDDLLHVGGRFKLVTQEMGELKPPTSHLGAWTKGQRAWLTAMAIAAREGGVSTWKSLWAAANCGTFAKVDACDHHGPQNSRCYSFEKVICCPWENFVRTNSIVAMIDKGWNEVVTANQRCADMKTRRLPVLTDDGDPITKAIRGWRGRAISVVVIEGPEGPMETFFERKRWLERHLEKHTFRHLGRWRRIIWGARGKSNFYAVILTDAYTAEDMHLSYRDETRFSCNIYRNVSFDDLTPLLKGVWSSVGIEFQKMVLARDEDVMRWPWLMGRFKRTSADKKGDECYPWPTNEAVRAECQQQARARRMAATGIPFETDPTKCLHTDDDGCCYRTLTTYLTDELRGRVVHAYPADEPPSKFDETELISTYLSRVRTEVGRMLLDQQVKITVPR